MLFLSNDDNYNTRIDWYGKKRNQKKIIAMIQGITKVS